MSRSCLRRAAGLLGLAFLLCGAGAPARAEAVLRPKPPDFASSGGPGETRRIIHPFGDWTLICDENVKKKRKVCNVSQSFVDGAGQTVFSWSLAATASGSPVLIMRARNDGTADVRNVKLTLPGLAKPQEVWLSACEATLCIGYQEVGAELGKGLRAAGNAELRIMQAGQPLSVASDLKNLNAALAALK